MRGLMNINGIGTYQKEKVVGGEVFPSSSSKGENEKDTSPDIKVSFSDEAIAKATEMNSSRGGKVKASDFLNPGWQDFLRKRATVEDINQADTKDLLSRFLRSVQMSEGGINNRLDSCLNCGQCKVGGGDLGTCPVGVWDFNMDFEI